MATDSQVYNYENQIKRLLASVKSSNIHESNKQAFDGFHRYLVVNAISQGRILKYLHEIFKLAQLAKKPFCDFVKNDVVELVAHIESNTRWGEWTKHDYKLALKRLFKFIRDTEDYPEEVRWVKIWFRSSKRAFPEILSEEEVRRIAEVCTTPRDKALVLFLYESGCRIGEVLSMRVKDIVFDRYGGQVFVNGKTGPRRIRVVASVPVLAFWIDYHPEKHDPNAPLWVSFGRKKALSLLAPACVADLLRRLARLAGIRKRVYPHLFRHSRATALAKVFTEAQLKQFMGWTQGSKEAATYVHLSGRDVDEAILRINGMEFEEQTDRGKFAILTCERCGMKNSPGTNLCIRCGSEISPRLQTTKHVTEKVERLPNELRFA